MLNARSKRTKRWSSINSVEMPRHAGTKNNIRSAALFGKTNQCRQMWLQRIIPPLQLQSVAKSDFHLYAGSSTGRIVAFALGQVCLRPDKHRCHLHDEPQWFCEQVRLRGLRHAASRLFLFPGGCRVRFSETPVCIGD